MARSGRSPIDGIQQHRAKKSRLEALRRRTTEAELRHRLEFEAIVTAISTEFINLAATQIDDGINRALKTIGEFIEADRSYVFQFRDDGRKVDNTHEWCAEGIGPQVENLEGMVVDDELPWFGEIIRRREVFEVPCVAKMPAEAEVEKEHFELQGIQSLIVVPMVCRDRLMGFVGFDSVRTVRKWQSESVSLLRMVGEVFAGALDHKFKEDALRDSEERFRTLFESAPDSIYLSGLEGIIVDGNKASERLVGYSREELIGRSFVDAGVLSPEQMPKAFANLQKNALGEATGPDEFRLTRKDGSCVDVEIRSFPVQISDGTFVLGIARDITERRKSEETMRLHSKIMTNMLEAVHLVRAEDGIIVYTNPECEKMFGYSQDEMLGRHISIVNAPADKQPEETSKEIVEHLKSKGTWEGEINNLRKDGTDFWCYARVSVFNHPKFGKVFLSVHTDITETKKAEEELRISEANFRQLFEQAPGPVELYAMDGLQLQVNKAYETMWGFPKSTSVNKFNVLKSEEVIRTGLIEYVKRAYAGESVKVPEYMYDPRGKTESGGPGRVRWLSTRIYPLKDSTGATKNIVIMHEDITERKLAEEELRRSEAELESIFRAAPIGIGLVSNRVLLRVNDGMCEITGYSSEELVGQNARMLYPTQQEYERVGRVKYTQIRERGTETIETRFRRKDGKIIDVLLSSTPLNPADLSVGVTFTALDITARNRASREILKKQEMLRSLASQLVSAEEHERKEIATGLHDDIIQPLVFLDIKLKTLGDGIADQDLSGSFTEMRKIIAELIQKSRTLTFDLSDPVLNELGLEAAIERQLAEYVEQQHGLKTTFADDQQPKPLDEDVKVILSKAVKELLTNIIKHANAKSVQVKIVKDDDNIAVRVDDDGIGFDYKAMDARPDARTHYGLFSIRERLDYLGGTVSVESKPGHGSSFVLTAPLKRKPDAE